MTCFWDSLLSQLNSDDFVIMGLGPKPASPSGLLSFFKAHNREPHNVSVNGSFLTQAQKTENVEWVRSYDAGGIGNGHLTGTCDPFLVLACEVFRVAIRHSSSGSLPSGYNFDSVVVYSHNDHRRLVTFGSNAGHFYVK